MAEKMLIRRFCGSHNIGNSGFKVPSTEKRGKSRDNNLEKVVKKYGLSV